MSTPSSNEGDKRTLEINIPDARGKELRALASEAGSTLEEYLSAKLEAAISDGSLFEFVRKRQDEGPALSS